MPKLNQELAKKEITTWLDYKKIKPKKREEQSESVEMLVEAFMDGDLVLNEETFVLTQKLVWPLKDEDGKDSVMELNYKPRLRLADVKTKLTKVKTNDIQGMLLCYMSGLTQENSGLLATLDTEDYRLAQTITSFFF